MSFLAEWPKPPDNVVRVELARIHGRQRVDIRVWRPELGALKPTKAGLDIQPEQLVAFRDLIDQAITRAREAGVIPA